MYTDINFKTKKELRDAVASGRKVTCFQPNQMFGEPVRDGKIYLEGPHYPKPHRWYATAIVKDGVIVSVK